MIEVISSERCTSCNICVTVCPTNVFDVQDDGPPVIARQSDCQTCYMCEVWCPDDALYVAPNADRVEGFTTERVEALDLFGSYRKAVGWAKGGRVEPAPQIMQRLR